MASTADRDNSLLYALDILGGVFGVYDGVAWTNLASAGSGNHTTIAYVPDVSAVPVPGAIWLFGSGILGLVAAARRRST